MLIRLTEVLRNGARALLAQADTDMYFRKASTRGVIVTYDMIQTPPTRVAIVTSAKRPTALIAATASDSNGRGGDES